MKKSVLKLWGKPFLFAILLLGGLIGALAGNGIWDYLCCLALAIPVLVVVRKYYFCTK